MMNNFIIKKNQKQKNGKDKPVKVMCTFVIETYIIDIETQIRTTNFEA